MTTTPETPTAIKCEDCGQEVEAHNLFEKSFPASVGRLVFTVSIGRTHSDEEENKYYNVAKCCRACAAVKFRLWADELERKILELKAA